MSHIVSSLCYCREYDKMMSHIVSSLCYCREYDKMMSHIVSSLCYGSEYDKMMSHIVSSLCYCREYAQALQRLAVMTPGIGDPLVGVYARCYLCRVSTTLYTISFISFICINFSLSSVRMYCDNAQTKSPAV